MGKDLKNKNIRFNTADGMNAGETYIRETIFHSLSSRIRKARPLMISSATMLFFLGMTVVTIAMLGLIRPLWLASMMSIAGSLSTILGLYMWYELLRDKHQMDTFVKEAIQRAMNSHN